MEEGRGKKEVMEAGERTERRPRKTTARRMRTRKRTMVMMTPMAMATAKMTTNIMMGGGGGWKVGNMFFDVVPRFIGVFDR